MKPKANRYTSWLVLFTIFATCWSAVPAHATPVKCDRRHKAVDLSVVYANGMLTTIGTAKHNLERIRPLVDDRLKQPSGMVSYAIAFNDGKGYLESVAKVFRERFGMSASYLIRILSGLAPMPEALSEEISKLAAEFDQSAFEDDPHLDKQVMLYREHLRIGRKIVVIAHSEGNMYANAAYRRLFQSGFPTEGERRFGIVGIATPTDTIAGWQPALCSSLGCYTTFHEDLVIQYVRSQFPTTAPSNVGGALLSSFTDLGWHGLEASYLKNSKSRTQILNQVAAFVDAFEPLQVIEVDNDLIAKLEWKATADLDLHVFEKFGTGHVYTDFAQGIGQLNLDDTDGGAEQYGATCGALEEGDIRIAIGYFEGNGPVKADLLLKIGGTVRQFSRVLADPTGEHSLHYPENVVTVRVANRYEPRKVDNYLLDEYEIELAEFPDLD